MEEDKEYRCGSCDTMTVSMKLEWDRMMTRYEEELFAVYTCCRCGGTLSLETDRRSNDKDYGDTIDVEGGYDVRICPDRGEI
jgi:DNA-directed RNA polymerase subunit RPC12/RpoP